MADFRRYRVWQSSHSLVLDLYRATESFPSNERFDLVRQIRRAGASIPANLAEGLRKSGDKERGRYANMAIGSAYELDYHLQLALDLGYLNEAQHTPLLTTIKSVRRMLVVLRRKLTANVR